MLTIHDIPKSRLIKGTVIKSHQHHKKANTRQDKSQQQQAKDYQIL